MQDKAPKRRSLDSDFKMKVAQEAINGERPRWELATGYHILPAQVSEWREDVLEKSKELGL